ncbi:hypothetical protein EDD16DRAFT_1614787 [Pisolithus croceorrhizus]|nr:hypothetical protein EV401DRAFT_2047136 [Pisolithus croceorrhizus]KAI6109314.1 hypothetical protein EDD16DRAFT_1614787 [Pisolithus croceorrhizus]
MFARLQGPGITLVCASPPMRAQFVLTVVTISISKLLFSLWGLEVVHLSAVWCPSPNLLAPCATINLFHVSYITSFSHRCMHQGTKDVLFEGIVASSFLQQCVRHSLYRQSNRKGTTMCCVIRIRIHLVSRRRPLALLSCVHNYTSILVIYGLQSSLGAVTRPFQRPQATLRGR